MQNPLRLSLAVLAVVVMLAAMFARASRGPIDAPPVARTIPAPDQTETRRRGSVTAARATIARLAPLHKTLSKPGPSDWLANHEEAGQTFAEYLKARPVTPTGRRTVIYVQPLGEFGDEQRQIVELSAEYLGLYFNRPVKILKDLPASVIPSKARRTHPEWKVKQFLSTYVLYDVLKPRLPEDAAAYIAFTATDLWPGQGWNFVFGQASLRDRVGVWSIQRNGEPENGPQSFRICLRRTLKTATHETGHMFSIKHCTAFQCNMCGSNHREESDRHPLFLGPECHAKICWATNVDPIQRYQRLEGFCEKQGLTNEASYFKEAQAALARSGQEKE